MYCEKDFRIRLLVDTLEDLVFVGEHYGQCVDKLFVVDGDALVMFVDYWFFILEAAEVGFFYLW